MSLKDEPNMGHGDGKYERSLIKTDSRKIAIKNS
jgi:hypothetical protein